MKSKAVQIAALVLGLVAAASMQDLSPAAMGVKPPLVAIVVLFVALRMPTPFSLATAFVAGLFVDALSGRPTFCATSLMPLLALGVRLYREIPGERSIAAVGAVAASLGAVLGEAWIAVFGFATGDAGLFVRMCAAACIAAPIGAMLFALLPHLAKCIGLEDEE